MFEQRENEKVGLFNPWNFLFYLSIGLSIVLAVRAGGVIPVFSYLIIPAVSAIMLGRSNWSVVVIALIVSTLGGVFGLWFALHFDFPAGSSIVAMLGAVFALVAIIRAIKGAPLKKAAAGIRSPER